MITKSSALAITLYLTSSCISVAAQKNLSADFEKQPSLKWKFATGGAVIATPVISDGVAYFGGTDSVIYAIDIQTGQKKWSIKTGGEIRSSGLIKDNFLYQLGGNGILSCIDKIKGTVAWRKIFDNTALFLGERKYDFADYYQSTPILDNGTLYFGTGNGRFHAVDATNGEERWNFKAGDMIHNKAVIDKGKIFFGCFDGYLYALNLQNGSLLWKFKSAGHRYFPGGEMQGSPSVSHGTVFIGSRDYTVYAVDANAGNCYWLRRIEHGWGLATTTNDSILFVGTSDDRALLAYDTEYGNQVWKTDVHYNIFGDCLLGNTTLYVGTIWGKLYGIESKTGRIKWNFATDGYTRNHSKYFKPDESFRDDIGEILKSGAMWIGAEYSMGGIFSTPAVSGNIMVVTTAEGIVYGLEKEP